MRRRCILAITMAAALACAAPAHANHNGRPSIDHYVLGDGTGQLIANPGGHPIE